MPYIIVGAALIVIGVLWLSLYIFTSRKTTVETTDMNPVNATEADIARVEEAQRKLRVTYIKTAVNMLVPVSYTHLIRQSAMSWMMLKTKIKYTFLSIYTICRNLWRRQTL